MLRSIRSIPFAVPALLALIAIAVPAGAQEDRRVTFEAFDLEDARPLFKGETTTQAAAGRVRETMVYRDLDGRETQRMVAEYEEGTLALVSYKRTYLDSKEWEQLEREGDRLRMTFQGDGDAKPKTKELAWKDGMAWTAVVAARIKQERDTLQAGKEVTFDLIVPSRMDVYEFRLRLDKPVTLGGRNAWVVRMEPDSFVIRQMVDPLYFYFAEDGAGELLEYRGRTSVHDAKGKPIDAHVVYHGEP